MSKELGMGLVPSLLIGLSVTRHGYFGFEFALSQYRLPCPRTEVPETTGFCN